MRHRLVVQVFDLRDLDQRQPQLAVRRRADHLAAQRAFAILATIKTVRDRQRRYPVKENHPVKEFSGRHPDGFTKPAWGPTNGIYSHEA